LVAQFDQSGRALFGALTAIACAIDERAAALGDALQ
jgi:hypothetical protein